MALLLSVPVNISSDAEARVSELGQRREFEIMLEQVGRFIPGLIGIRVILVPDYDDGGDPGIMIYGHVDPAVGTQNSGRAQWNAWSLGAFPPEILQHYSVWTLPLEAGHAW